MLIKGSRTLTLLALLCILDACFAVFVEQWTNLGVTPARYAAVSILMKGILAYLRFVTTTPVGGK